MYISRRERGEITATEYDGSPERPQRHDYAARWIDTTDGVHVAEIENAVTGQTVTLRGAASGWRDERARFGAPLAVYYWLGRSPSEKAQDLLSCLDRRPWRDWVAARGRGWYEHTEWTGLTIEPDAVVRLGVAGQEGYLLVASREDTVVTATFAHIHYARPTGGGWQAAAGDAIMASGESLLVASPVAVVKDTPIPVPLFQTNHRDHGIEPRALLEFLAATSRAEPVPVYAVPGVPLDELRAVRTIVENTAGQLPAFRSAAEGVQLGANELAAQLLTEGEGYYDYQRRLVIVVGSGRALSRPWLGVDLERRQVTAAGTITEGELAEQEAKRSRLVKFQLRHWCIVQEGLCTDPQGPLPEVDGAAGAAAPAPTATPAP